MDELGCDYECRTVGESITKHNIPDDWYAEFDACDGTYPIVVIQVARIRKVPAVMELKLSMIEHPDEEYAGCMVLTEAQTIAFKVDFMRDLIKAVEQIYKV